MALPWSSSQECIFIQHSFPLEQNDPAHNSQESVTNIVQGQGLSLPVHDPLTDART
jgi:hypothetical protein